MARILLGVSGGIAAYKSLELTRLAIKAGHHVRVAQTPDSLNFVGKASFEGITGAPVLTDQFESDPAGGTFPDQERPTHDPISHLELAANCDVYVIAPATANTIAKLAAGMADNMVSALALSCRKPMLVAPAMNNDMYLNAATRANIQTLRDRGITVIEPGTGELASKGEYGIGRLPEPSELLAEAERLASGAEAEFAPRSLDGLKVLISAGGTREPIDSVRFVGNRSSGRMGFAVAEAASARGAEVTVVAANVSLPRNPGIEYVDVQTAAELEAAVRERFIDADVLVMSAAVADFRPSNPSDGKIKKRGRDGMTVELEATDDVLAGLSDLRRAGQVIVGFAAEAGPQLIDEARGKLERKDLDLVVANDISNPEIGFEVDTNEVTIVGREGFIEQPPRGSKTEVAHAIVECVETLRRQRAGTSNAPQT
ncbi:MAG TPA: bifunctional phosphopantothenoylcysteine decarboxylase/phosphopantothenate--cysteine ligase CoaBC [Solirubrobacterales bacterium]|jgi:phosphopantothenoylcysteine decarboxylase/phosphopantothenate--cysteine ligase|nr:bifunctional phosphopantothenoylcysteine decarboxylase/phosphopantothenate--cysteine ligase CoaBC [Solirubrobacterales bacterium]